MTGTGGAAGRRRGLVGRLAGAAVAVLVFVLAAAPSASATKYFDSFFGGTSASPALGGTFNQPRGGEVNESSVPDAHDGWLYVADSSNHRVQAFDGAGAFQFAIGRDVVQEGTGGDTPTDRFERCTVVAECKIGVTGAPAQGGELDDPQGVAVGQSDGHIFVRDRDNRRVQEFTGAGDFVRAWGWNVDAVGGGGQLETCFTSASCQAGTIGSGDGQFGSSSTATYGGIVVQQSTGKVFVIDPGNTAANRRVLEFDVPANPADPVAFASKFGVASTLANHPRALTIDSKGIVYGTTSPSSGAGNEQYVFRYDTNTGTFLPEMHSAALGSAGLQFSLAVDASTDHLLVGRNPSTGILEFDLTDTPATVDASHLVDTHTLGLFTGGSVAQGLAVNSVTGQYFLSAGSGAGVAATGSGHRIIRLDANGVDPSPSVELLPALDPTATTAVLGATINPNGPTGFPTSYRFQVSTNGVTWTDVSADSLVGGTGDGSAPVTIQETATDLEANTFYRFRVVTTRSPSAGTSISAEQVFQTDPGAAAVDSPAAQHVSASSAQLVGRINPGGLPTEYWFEWGDTSYGNQAPSPAGSAGSGGTLTRVGQTLTGLDPERTYHFRLCARNSLVTGAVCSTDRTFETRAIPSSPGGERAYEMATSPDKALRRGGRGGQADADFGRLTTGLATPDGDALVWAVFGGVSDPDAGNGFANGRAWEIRRRTAGGWVGRAVQTIPPLHGIVTGVAESKALSSDLGVQIWLNQASLFESGSQLSTHVVGDSGGPRDAGWYPILEQDWFDGPLGDVSQLSARVADNGASYVAWSNTESGSKLRTMSPSDTGVAPTELVPAQTAGYALFAFRSPDWRPADLVSECTGAVADGDATKLPSRSDSGTSGDVSDDVIGVRDCEEGSPTSVRGAAMAVQEGGRLASFAPRMLSEDGRRVFFQSPDPWDAQAPNFSGTTVGGNGSGSCAGQYYFQDLFIQVPQPPAVGALTACPPQLFVRQYDAEGNGTVRWISRAEDALFDAPQGIGMFGNGASFEGASRDGSVVYFRTNAPLTVDDINGGTPSLTEGEASHLSWDLYRYELPTGPDADPADGVLTRISGGPSKATGTGDTTSGSTSIVNITTSTGNFERGQVIAGPGIPAGTTIMDVAAGTVILSQAATANANGVAIRAAADPNTNCGIAAPDCGGISTAPVSAGGANGNGIGGAARYVSNDGSKVYFVTASRMGPADAPWNTPPDGGATTAGGTASGNITTRNLYLYDSTKTGEDAYRFIAQLPSSNDLTSLTACATTASNPGGAPRRARIPVGVGDSVLTRPNTSAPNCVHGTTSGDAVVFETAGQLTGDDVDQAVDVYLYDASRDELIRVSAPPPGAAPYPCMTTSQGIPTEHCNGDLGMIGDGGEATSDGGSSIGVDGLSHFNLAEDAAGHLTAVYFQTRLKLVGKDVNSDHMDVYEWREGNLTLISPGTTANSSFFSGSSRSGRDVFFATEQPIDPREIDEADGDIYDARIGGGFPPPAIPPAVCAVLADGCQGPGAHSTPPSLQTNGTSNTGAASIRPRLALRIASLSRSAKRQAIRSGTLPVRVSSNDSGVVRVTARARLGRKMVFLDRLSKRYRVEGTKTIRIRLGKRVLGLLRTGHRLPLEITVNAGGARERTMRLILRGRS